MISLVSHLSPQLIPEHSFFLSPIKEDQSKKKKEKLSAWVAFSQQTPPKAQDLIHVMKR